MAQLFDSTQRYCKVAGIITAVQVIGRDNGYMGIEQGQTKK